MYHKVWAIACYALDIALLLALLFVHDSLARLVIAGLLLIDQASLLILLFRERTWDGTHRLGLAYLFLTGTFALLYLVVKTIGVTYLLGAVLVLATMALIILELVAGWRSYRFVDRMVNRNPRPESHKDRLESHEEDETDDVIVETVTAKRPCAYKLVTMRNSNVYHKESCPTLQKTPVAQLVELSSEQEAESYGLKPCRFCRP